MCLKSLCNLLNSSDVAQNIKFKRKLNMDSMIWTLNVTQLNFCFNNMFQSMFLILLEMKTMFFNKLFIHYYWNQISHS
jgi:hypothetical protein